MLLSRRRFLQRGTLLTGAFATGALSRGICAAGASIVGPAMAADSIRKQLVTRAIPGAAGETLPIVGMGTWNTFDVGEQAEERAPLLDVLESFYEAGAKLIDSSPMYGEAERVTGDLVEQLRRRDRTFVATKVWTRGRDAGVTQIERSMRLLRVSQIDLLQIHNLVDWQAHVPTLRQLKDAGRLRYTGVTHYAVSAHSELRRVLQSERFDFAQFNYSIATRDAERSLLPFCADNGIGVLINRPFEEGALFTRVRGRPLPAYAKEFDCTSWAQFFLKYILSHPAVTCVIPATSRAAHMRDNLQAAMGRLPDAKLRQRMVKDLER
jgi:aryl-alcohol dehydrogenase-like predicted oxidoreductase